MPIFNRQLTIIKDPSHAKVLPSKVGSTPRQCYPHSVRIQNPAIQTNRRWIANYGNGNHRLSLSAWKRGGLKNPQRNMTSTCVSCLTGLLKQVRFQLLRPRPIILRVIIPSTPRLRRSLTNIKSPCGTSGQPSSHSHTMVSAATVFILPLPETSSMIQNG